MWEFAPAPTYEPDQGFSRAVRQLLQAGPVELAPLNIALMKQFGRVVWKGKFREAVERVPGVNVAQSSDPTKVFARLHVSAIDPASYSDAELARFGVGMIGAVPAGSEISPGGSSAFHAARLRHPEAAAASSPLWLRRRAKRRCRRWRRRGGASQ